MPNSITQGLDKFAAWLRLALRPATTSASQGSRIKCVVVCPKYDRLTTYLHDWGQQLARTQGAIFLGDRECTTDRLLEELDSLERDLVVFAGHGTRHAWLTAPDLADEAVLDAHGQLHGVLVGAQQLPRDLRVSTLAAACRTGLALGPAVRRFGQRPRYLGYRDVVAFCPDRTVEAAFIEPITTTVRSAMNAGEMTADAGHELRRQYEHEWHSIAAAPCMQDKDIKRSLRMWRNHNIRSVDTVVT